MKRKGTGAVTCPKQLRPSLRPLILPGLKDRVEALGGRIFLYSPHGAGTSLQVELPLTTTNGGDTSGQGSPHQP